MLVFSKDISNRDHKHSCEGSDPEIRRYMEYQRRLFPYTVVRAGLDLAYKELDDIMDFVDNGYQPPADSERKEYPADIEQWYKTRFPWCGAFITRHEMHDLLVYLIKSMDSFRTYERPNTYHWMVLYDSVQNIVTVYNELLKDNPSSARDITLSQGVEVHFEDFINNYWTQLEFMLLSKPDYAHAPLMGRNRDIESRITQSIAGGALPLEALKEHAEVCGLDDATLELMSHKPVDDRFKVPETLSSERPYDGLDEDSETPGLSRIDAAYSENFSAVGQEIPNLATR